MCRQCFPEIFRDSSRSSIGFEASEASRAGCDQLSGLLYLIRDAETGGSNVIDLHIKIKQVVEVRGAFVFNVCCNNGEVDLLCFELLDFVTKGAEEFDARDFKVGEVLAVVDDTLLIRLIETNANLCRFHHGL